MLSPFKTNQQNLNLQGEFAEVGKLKIRVDTRTNATLHIFVVVMIKRNR